MKLHIRTALLCALIFGALPSIEAFDFTPRYASVNEDGITVNKLYFTNAGRKILLTIPRDWTGDGGQTQISFRSTNQSQGIAVFRLLRGGPLPFDEKNLKTFRGNALALAPKESLGVTIVSETPNPFPINGWSSYDIQIGYDNFGQHWLASVTYVKITAAEMLEVVVAAPDTQFAALKRGANAALTSWHYQ